MADKPDLVSPVEQIIMGILHRSSKFDMVRRGQFAPASGGQFHRLLHVTVIMVSNGLQQFLKHSYLNSPPDRSEYGLHLDDYEGSI
jgi:hypothetical protein